MLVEISLAPSASSTAASSRPSCSARSTGPTIERRRSTVASRLPAKARSESSTTPSPLSTTSARAPTGAVQPASSAASSARSAATQARVSASSRGASGGDHVGPVLAALDREGSLPRGGQHLQRVDELAHLVEAPEPGQARTGQDDRVVPAVVDQPQPGVDVAADRLDAQAEAERGELRGAARGAGADDRAGGQLTEGEPVAGDERVAGVLAHRDRRDDQAGLGCDRQVLERVHREVDLAALQGVPDGGGEDAGAADGGQRRGRGVAEGGDLDQLDLVAERPQLVGDPPGLGGREGAAAGAEPDHPGRRSRQGRGVGAAVGGAGAHASGPVSGGTDTAATSCGSRSNRSRSAWA